MIGSNDKRSALKPTISTSLVAWLVSLLAHGILLISVGTMTLSGGKPSQPGSTEITLNLAALPAPEPATPTAAPSKPAPVTPQPTAPKPVEKPKPKPKPKPTPTAKPEPKPQPEPEPAPQNSEQQLAEQTEQAEQTAQQEQASAQPAGAKGRAGEPGEGVHQQGDDDNLLDRYLAQVRELIDRNKQYPHQARARRQEGQVRLSFVIDASGRASRVEVLDSSGSRILDRAAEQLISRLRFAEPPRELPQIPVRVIAPLDYNLSQG